MLTEVERTQQDVESQQVGKHVPHILRQEQMVYLYHRAKLIG